MIVHGKQKQRGKRNNGDIKEPEDKKEDSNSKFLHINNHFICNWIKFTNHMAQVAA